MSLQAEIKLVSIYTVCCYSFRYFQILAALVLTAGGGGGGGGRMGGGVSWCNYRSWEKCLTLRLE